MTQEKTGRMKALARAASVLGLSLGVAGGVAGVASAADEPNASAPPCSGQHCANQHKMQADYLKRNAGGPASNQIKFGSRQDKTSPLVSGQHKTVHELNPQPLPPG